jgi:hypothetical protein
MRRAYPSEIVNIALHPLQENDLKNVHKNYNISIKIIIYP